MARTLNPSQVAKTIAAQTWGEVQSQTRLCPGVYSFSSAGHGGLVAVIEHAPGLPDEAVEAARATGRLGRMFVVHNRPRRQFCWEANYDSAELEKHIAHCRAIGIRVKTFTCWIAEEDLEYATILCSSEPARLGYAKMMTDPAAWEAKFTADYFRSNIRESTYSTAEFLLELERLERGTQIAPRKAGRPSGLASGAIERLAPA